MIGTITTTPGNGLRLTWSAADGARLVRVGNAATVDGAINALVGAGVPRGSIAVESRGVRVAV